VRGAVVPNETSDNQLPFNMIEDGDEVTRPHLPFSTIQTQTGEGKIGERLEVVFLKEDDKKLRFLFDMIDHRIDLNECEKMIADFAKNYLQDRHLWSLPFLLFTPNELALLVHLPDAKLGADLHFKTTRSQSVPRMNLPGKPGIKVGTC